MAKKTAKFPKLRLEVNFGNEAMQTTQDAGEALAQVAKELKSGKRSGFIIDLNGNTVGSWAIG